MLEAIGRSRRDPALSTPDERLREIAELLARGFTRSQRAHNQLADLGEHEHSCDDAVNAAREEEVA
jgi:hypothetical protein